jgi:hypothetical protein
MNSVDEIHPQMSHNVQASNGMEVSLLACLLGVLLVSLWPIIEKKKEVGH